MHQILWLQKAIGLFIHVNNPVAKHWLLVLEMENHANIVCNSSGAVAVWPNSPSLSHYLVIPSLLSALSLWYRFHAPGSVDVVMKIWGSLQNHPTASQVCSVFVVSCVFHSNVSYFETVSFENLDCSLSQIYTNLFFFIKTVIDVTVIWSWFYAVKLLYVDHFVM